MMTTRLHVAHYGHLEKPVLILLHPIGTLHQIWLPLIPQLVENYHILAPDLYYDDGTALTFSNLIEDLQAILPEDRCVHLVGVGIGADLALCLSARAPLRIASQTLIGAALNNTQDAYRRLRWLIQYLPQSWLIRFQLAGMHYMDNHSRAALLVGMNQLGKAGLLAQIDAYQSYQLDHSLREIPVPSLLFYGELDESAHLRGAQILARELPSVAFELVKRASCGACFDAQEHFVSVLWRHVMAHEARPVVDSMQIKKGDVVHSTP